MKKRFLSLLLCLVLVLGLLPTAAFAASHTAVGYTVNPTISADSYFCGTEGHSGEVTSVKITSVSSSGWDGDSTRPLTVIVAVMFKCDACGISGGRTANNALQLTFRDANSCHAPFNATVTARKLYSGRNDSITFTLTTSDKIGYAEKIDKKDATCTESGISQTCWECQGCKQIFSDANCTNKIANDVSGVTVPASNHSLTHYPAQEANCQQNGWVEHWKCSKCNGYFLDAAGSKRTDINAVMLYDQSNHVGETKYESYYSDTYKYTMHRVYPSCHPNSWKLEGHVLGDSSKGEDPDSCVRCGLRAAAKVKHSDAPYTRYFFYFPDATADYNESETSEEIVFLKNIDIAYAAYIQKAGTVRVPEGISIGNMYLEDCAVQIWNDGEIKNLTAYSSTRLRGSQTGKYGTITNQTNGGTAGDLLFGDASNWAYYVTNDQRWISRAAANMSSISNVRVLYKPFSYIEIDGTGIEEVKNEADTYALTATEGDKVTLTATTYAAGLIRIKVSQAK